MEAVSGLCRPCLYVPVPSCIAVALRMLRGTPGGVTSNSPARLHWRGARAEATDGPEPVLRNG